MQLVLALLIIGAAVVLSMGALFYGAMGFGWIMRRYPKTAAAVAVVLVMAVLFAAGSFSHFFPNCRGGPIGQFRCYPNHTQQRPQS
jgi:hypothetical protein